MIEIVLYNIVFWTAYGYLCSLPAIIMQKIIDGDHIDILV